MRTSVWLAGLVGLVLGVALAHWFDPFLPSRTAPEVRHRYIIHVSDDGTVIAVADRPDATTSGEGYVIYRTSWRRAGEEAWHSGTIQPPCLQPGQAVRLGVIHVRPRHAPGQDMVAWLECRTPGP